jgi:hypothetical protein
MVVLYFVQIGETRFICETHVQSWTLKLQAGIHIIKF